MDTPMTCEEFRRLYKEADLETIEDATMFKMGAHGDGCDECQIWVFQQSLLALSGDSPAS